MVIASDSGMVCLCVCVPHVSVIEVLGCAAWEWECESIDMNDDASDLLNVPSK